MRQDLGFMEFYDGFCLYIYIYGIVHNGSACFPPLKCLFDGTDEDDDQP